MKIKKKNVIKESILIESNLLDAISKFSPTDIKLLKGLIKRYGSGYTNKKDIVDDLIDNWGVSFATAIKVGHFFHDNQYYLTKNLEVSKDITKSDIFAEYLARFITKLEEQLRSMENDYIFTGLSIKYKDKDSDDICEADIHSTMWGYSSSYGDYQKSFFLYTKPLISIYNDKCYINRFNSVISISCDFSGVDDEKIKMKFRIKYDHVMGDSDNKKEVETFIETELPLPETLNDDIVLDWLHNQLYGDGIKKALDPMVFDFGYND